MYAKKLGLFIIVTTVLTGLLSAVYGVAAKDQPGAVISDADIAAELKLLLGDGSGVNDEYLSKPTTRMQAAIISLRLNGHLEEAMAYEGTSSFSDASLVNQKNQTILAYLKNHPEQGWSGYADGTFKPAANISSQQLYKVLLENIGYRSGADYSYAETEAFAASHGLDQIAGVASLTNAHHATALVESLSAETPDGSTFFAELQTSGVLSADAMLPQTERIRIASDETLGTYLADGNGRTLYYFTKDEGDLFACQGNCLVNWPIYASEQLQIPAFLNPEDFYMLTRPDGTTQWTYKGYPLYYFIQDKEPGDIHGQGVGDVWFVVDPESFALMGVGDAATYNVDIQEFSFGTEPLTVEAGSRIVFTNYDDMKHNAVAVDNSFKTPLLAKGESYTITLYKAGTYNYFCEPHKGFMTGQIIVK